MSGQSAVRRGHSSADAWTLRGHRAHATATGQHLTVSANSAPQVFFTVLGTPSIPEVRDLITEAGPEGLQHQDPQDDIREKEVEPRGQPAPGRDPWAREPHLRL